MSLEVVAFVPHPPAGASGRYRVTQLVAPLAERGIRMEVRPFLDDTAFRRLYAPGKVIQKAWDLARGARGRWRELDAAGRFDVALVHRELWPLIGRAAERRLAARQRRWVYDFDDAVFLPNVSDSNRAFRALKSFDQARRLAAGARTVAAGNAWLADWARDQRPGRPAGEVEVIPTSVDLRRWSPRDAAGSGGRRLVWIGSPSTRRYLQPIVPTLVRLAQRHPDLELHVIGATVRIPGVRVVCHAWSADDEVERVGRGDIGLAPLDASDWSRGKCGLKLLLYMAMGLPAVASAHGVHPAIATDGEDALLASTTEDFERALDRLIGDRGLRERLGRAARATVERGYSVEAVAPRLGALLERTREGG